jgi:hypothetical protein
MLEPASQPSSHTAAENTTPLAYLVPTKARRPPAPAVPPLEAPQTKPHQRVGSVSNAHVGADFEQVALQYFASQGIALSRNFTVEVGLSVKKVRNFDLGSQNPKVLVECKSHTWTAGARVPSAKMTVWNEAMYYFSLAPTEYRKVLFVLHNTREEGGESLLAYYTRTYAHLIPHGVEFLEWDESTGDIVKV